MKYLPILLFLLLFADLAAETTSLPIELYLRPWSTTGEISFLGIFEPEEKTRKGLILQIPFSSETGEEFRFLYLRTDRDLERRYFQIAGLAYRSRNFHPVGFQLRLGGSPETYGDRYAAVGIHHRQGSLECFGRKSLEGESFGLLLRSGPTNGAHLSLGFERVFQYGFPAEDRISFGAVWSGTVLIAEARLGETEKSIVGYTILGVSPFGKLPEQETKENRIPPPRERKPIPILSPEELLQLGFSLSESLSISSASRKDPESFQNSLLKLSEGKQKKIRRLLRKKSEVLR